MYEMDHDKYTSVKGSDNDYFNLTNTVLLQAQYYCDNARSDFFLMISRESITLLIRLNSLNISYYSGIWRQYVSAKIIKVRFGSKFTIIDFYVLFNI